MTDQLLASKVSDPPTNCELHTRAYRGDKLVDEGFDPTKLSDLMRDDCFVWLDLLNPDEADMSLVTEEFGLHPLATEDAIHEHQRPKLDHYDTHLFLSMYQVDLIEGDGIEHREIAVFVTQNALITVRKHPEFDIASVVKLWDDSPDLIHGGVAYLLWGLIDHVVDGHFTAVQEMDQEVEDLEDYIFSNAARDHAMQQRTFSFRKNLVTLRRVILPMREVVNALIRQDFKIVDKTMAPYFQDIYDHVLRATEWTESLRDLVQSLLEANLAIQSNHLNEVMKKLTAWAAIIAVPTAITGYYGQNVPYPGFNRQWGWEVSTALIIGIAGGLWATFRKAGWL